MSNVEFTPEGAAAALAEMLNNVANDEDATGAHLVVITKLPDGRVGIGTTPVR